MEDLFVRIVENLAARVSGPMHLRLYMQPLMATIFAIVSGLRDAKAGKPAYLWGLFCEPEHRGEMLRDGWRSVGKVFIAAMLLDVIYQLIVERWVYPLEVVLVAFILAILPYLMLRGLITRIASLARHQGTTQRRV